MTVWNAWVEWYFELTASGPSEGTHWQWVTKSILPTGWPPWLALLILLAVSAGIVWSYRRDADRLSVGQRGVLTGLRLLAIAVALGLWTQPEFVVARSGLPAVVLLYDTSASMGLRDGDPSAVGDTAVTTTNPRRWDRVLEAISAKDSRFLTELAARHPVRQFQFSSTATPLAFLQSSEGIASYDLSTSLKTLTVDGLATRPAEAVRQVLAELRGMPPTALIVFTDGIASESELDKLSTVADLVRKRGVALFAVPVGTNEPVRDLHLFDVVMDEVAFVNDPVIIAGKLKATGLGISSVLLRVRAEGRSEPLVEQTVPIKEGETAGRFELLLTPTEPAELELTIEAVPVAGEVNLENNRERRLLAVREERLNVLLLESAPRYEFRYLKQWLERDPSVTLQTLLLESDPEYVREDRTAIAYFPVQKEDLWRYDVVILGDVSPAALGSTAAEWLAQFVREKGGGLLMMAGPRHNPASFLNTPLEGLLPMPADAVDSQTLRSSSMTDYNPRLTLDGQKGVPMFRFENTEVASLEVWNSLPGLYGLLPIRRLKPGVRTLVEHPYTQGEAGRLPVITLQQIGAGKVLFHATDELWRWRFRVGDRYFGRYYGQAIRYLSRSKLLGKDRTAELLVDRQTYVRGEPVLLRVRFLDDRLVPSQDDGVVVVVEREGAGRREVALSRLPHLPTVFEGTLTGFVDGTYHAWLSRPSFELAPPATDFRVESQQRELRQRAVDRADLQLAAQLSGGQVVELSDIGTLPELIPAGRLIPLEQGRSVPLWSRFEPLLLLVGLLISEWTLRRRWRLV